MAENRKWACEYCTYENWPASKKCVLCRAARTPQFITEQVPPPFEPDIYKMASLVSQENLNQDNAQSPTSSTQPDPSSAGGKWPCQVCTYLNWPRSQKCTQCSTVRPKVIPVMTASRDCTKPLSISVSIESAASSGSSLRKSPRNSPRPSPRTSPNSPEAAKALNNDKNRALVAAKSTSIKWSCKVCTYENWPKATRCVLCGIVKGRNSPTSSEVLAVGEGEVNNRSAQKRRSPPSSARSLENSEIQQLGGATASPVIHQEKHDKNRNGERRLRQFRNRLREMDWLWLNACQGVVEGDASAVEAYLASGGDGARQLTQEECLFLNRPSAFQTGYTLVHLAIRFQREDMLAVLLTASDVTTKARKRMPSHASPDIAADILRSMATSLRQRKGDFPCYFLTECTTFTLPAGKMCYNFYLTHWSLDEISSLVPWKYGWNIELIIFKLLPRILRIDI